MEKGIEHSTEEFSFYPIFFHLIIFYLFSASSLALDRTAILTTMPRPQSTRDYTLNLSILLSGRKETNKDLLSSCDRTGICASLNPAVPPLGNVE